VNANESGDTFTVGHAGVLTTGAEGSRSGLVGCYVNTIVLLLKTTAVKEERGNKRSKLSGATISPPDHTDSRLLPTVVRALKYYQRMLNNLSSNEEGESVLHEGDSFGNYLVNSAKEVGTAARELKENPYDVTKLVKEDRYRPIVQQALVFYIADLRRIQDIILGEELIEHVKRISSPYESELNAAETMLQSIK
jgi:hypothetical protein